MAPPENLHACRGAWGRPNRNGLPPPPWGLRPPKPQWATAAAVGPGAACTAMGQRRRRGAGCVCVCVGLMYNNNYYITKYDLILFNIELSEFEYDNNHSIDSSFDSSSFSFFLNRLKIINTATSNNIDNIQITIMRLQTSP